MYLLLHVSFFSLFSYLVDYVCVWRCAIWFVCGWVTKCYCCITRKGWYLRRRTRSHPLSVPLVLFAFFVGAYKLFTVSRTLASSVFCIDLLPLVLVWKLQAIN